MASIWSSSKIRRAPKPTMSPLASRIGHSSRRGTGRSARARPPRARPAPAPPRLNPSAQVLEERPAGGARIRPRTSPRRRRTRARPGTGAPRRLGRARAVGVELRGGLVRRDQCPRCGPFGRSSRRSPSSRRSCTPTVRSRSTASAKVIPSIFMQEREDVAALAAAEAVEETAVGVTWNEGDFSSWNGQSPFCESAPAWRRDVRRTTSSMRRLVADLGDVFVPDPSRHAAESTGARRARGAGSTSRGSVLPRHHVLERSPRRRTGRAARAPAAAGARPHGAA